MRRWAYGIAPTTYAGTDRAAHIRLFGMPTGFLSEPTGLDAGIDDPAPEPSTDPADEVAEARRIQLSVGNDNPCFDLRRPGMPGGIGYYRLDSQYQLTEGDRTALTVNLSAVTPAGLEADGLATGPTILSPSVAWFQDLGDGAALQGFVGKQIRADSRWASNLDSSIKCGLAVQCPVPGLCNRPDRGVYFFLEGLGRYRAEWDPQGRSLRWEIVPGIHWRMGENVWLSVGPTRAGVIVCSLRF